MIFFIQNYPNKFRIQNLENNQLKMPENLCIVELIPRNGEDQGADPHFEPDNQYFSRSRVTICFIFYTPKSSIK